jgi:hypothetical protein
MVEQGLSFTVLDAPHPLDGDAATYDARKLFRSAHRVWLGSTAGTDWLHEAVEAEFGKHGGWYDVESARSTTHIGASGEIATVLLILMGAGLLDFARSFYRSAAQRLGEATADAVVEWARERSVERRRQKGLESADGPPDFFDRELDGLAEGMAGELADVLGVPQSRLAVVRAARDVGVALRAVYEDRASGRRYEVVVGHDFATFTPL